MTDEINQGVLIPLEAAQQELSDGFFPHPDEFMETLTPHAALLFLRQVAMASAKVVLGAAISLEDDPDGDSGVIGEIQNGVAACVAGATHALVALEVLPAEAEEALR